MALFIIGSYTAPPHIPVYGAEWDGSSSPAWTRTDDAVGFADPNPYYAGMSGTPSSPFDDIMPWAGMRIVEDASAGTLVEIPKFYYKWTRNGSAMKLQISMNQEEGFLCSPAHADRGDSVGERDYVYIGRYHCASDYKSKTGVTPGNNTIISDFRSRIHNLGSNIWQNDFAMWWTVRMLYLVEFANWNSQEKIGYGVGNNSSIGNMGYTDNMGYHTGTTQTARTTYGLSTQYRNIEGLWDNVIDFIDGIYFILYNGVNNARVIKNPANFSNTSGGTSVGDCVMSNGFIKAWTNQSLSGYEYALVPSQVDSTESYVCDKYNYYTSASNGLVMGSGAVSGKNNNKPDFGLFHFGQTNGSTSANSYGSRLMVLPPSRLTA